MNNKINLLIILAIFILPIILYHSYSSSNNEAYMNEAKAVMSKPKVMDFSSELCYECKELDKAMKPLEPKYKDKIIFKKIYINTKSAESQKMIKKYAINVVPTLVFINKEGKVVRKVEGSISQQKLEGYLKSLADGK